MHAAPHSAAALGFAIRDRGAAPIVAQDIGLGEPLPAHDVGAAKHAELRMHDEAILVRAIRHEGDGTYSGEIYGFEPHHGVQFDGLKLGDRVVFREEHVFSCGK
jgi:hypothetical protein